MCKVNTYSPTAPPLYEPHNLGTGG